MVAQNEKITASVDRAHTDAFLKLKTRWSNNGTRVFSKKVCDATVLYGNIEGSAQGRNLLLLLNRYAPELNYTIFPPEVVDRILVTILTNYMKLSGVQLSLPSNTSVKINSDAVLASNFNPEAGYLESLQSQNSTDIYVSGVNAFNPGTQTQDTSVTLANVDGPSSNTKNTELILNPELFQNLLQG